MKKIYTSVYVVAVIELVVNLFVVIKSLAIHSETTQQLIYTFLSGLHNSAYLFALGGIIQAISVHRTSNK